VPKWQPSGPEPGKEHPAIPLDPAGGLPEITANRPAIGLGVIILTGSADRCCHPCHGV
jgi:hypothetical protein